MKTRMSAKFWFALVLFGLMGQVAWTIENMYLNVFIYKMFNASASQISVMVAASAIVATLTTIFMGALSDKIGKRKIFICGGYIFWGISILGFSLIRADLIGGIIPATMTLSSVCVSLVIAFDCLMTFFGSSANDAAFNAWLTDSVDSKNRGAAEGINAMMPLVSILVVFGGFMAFDLNLQKSWVTIFTIIGAVVILIGILGFFIIENPQIKASEGRYLGDVIYSFLPSTVKNNAPLYLYLICFLLFNVSIQIFMPYLIIYYEVSLGMADYVLIMAPAVIVASVVSAIWGRVYDKKGFATSAFISLAALCVGYGLLFAFESKAPVFVGSLFMMCGFLSGMAVFGAKIRDLTPAGQAGRFQGVRIVSQVLVPGILGPYIGKTVLSNAELILNSDGTTSFIPNRNIFMAALAVAVVTIIVTAVIAHFSGNKPRLNKNLKTPFEDDERSWAEEYPRPQLKRESYFSLCGEWELFSKIENNEEKIGKITVPFPPESRISGIERTKKEREKYIYRRTFNIEEGFNRGRILLNFGAVDQKAQVKINGTSVGSHIGGYLPFSFDITEAVRIGENIIEVEAEDELDKELPYGKQSKKRGGMWYTEVSGIWQTVWLESVPQNYISSLKITPTLDSVTICTKGGEDKKQIIVYTEEGEELFEYEGDTITLSPKQIHLWTPDTPYLYNFTLTDGVDTVSSYFALRTVGIEKRGERSVICLNGKPIFCHGLLDQGYYSDGIYLPASPRGYIFDILKMKECGFNMLRKHIKIEPELFYYYCDKHGMLVFQDMVNSGKYNFFLDTVLPTLGLKRGISHKPSKRRREFFEEHCEETTTILYNHPSVIYYTIFNEGWGQYDADRLYTQLKELDGTRIWDAVSGWFKNQLSDVESEHVYFKKVKLKPSEKPIILSEFGGYSCKLDGHSFNLDKTYGYKFLASREKFMQALRELYEGEVLQSVGSGLCGAVLTQVSDVEDETNGLLSYDRQILKVSPSEMKELSKKLYSEFEKYI